MEKTAQRLSGLGYVWQNRSYAEVRKNGAQTPPDYLRDAHYPGAEALGRGTGYQYAHDHPGSVAAQQYLPDALVARTFYEPSGNGREKAFGERLAELRRRLGKP